MTKQRTTDNVTTFKKDISLMEYPLYFLSEKQFTVQNIRKGKVTYKAKVWTQGNYWFEAQAGIPSDYDYIILVYLLILAQRNNYSTVIEVSIRDILKGCDIDPGSAWYYQRVKTSLEVWERVRFHFEGDSFRYKDPKVQGGYETKFKELHAGIISNWAIVKGTTNLRISLDDQFIEMTRSSRFYKNIGFNDLKQLRGEPTATRLHEILLKSFEAADSWEIGVKKLGLKLTIPDTYPSRIKAKVMAAIKIINKKTSRNFEAEYLDKKSGCKIPKFRFQIIREGSKSSQPNRPACQDNIFFQDQLPGMCLPKERRQDIIELVDFFYEYIAKTYPDKRPADIKAERESGYDIVLALEETDGFNMDVIKDVLVFGVRDPFWKDRFFTLLNLRDVAGNSNTTFQNMVNAFQGKRNPSGKSTAGQAAKENRQSKNISAITNFLKQD